MSPRKKEQNEALRDKRCLQILDAALTVYIAKGYNGTDMDEVAAEAGLAKGLAYYYFKNKQELFRAAFDWAFGFLIEANQGIAASVAGPDPVARLVRYVWGVFVLAEKDSRLLRFAMRLPFDAYAVFGPKEWKKGFERASLHRDTLASMIADIASAGLIPPLDANTAANSFWAVLISNCYNLTAMVGVSRAAEGKTRAGKVRDIVTFCFQGLGLPYQAWGKYLDEMEKET